MAEDLDHHSAKKRRLQKSFDSLTEQADKLAVDAEKELMMGKTTTLLAQSNTLQAKSKDRRKEIEECDKITKELEDSLQR